MSDAVGDRAVWWSHGDRRMPISAAVLSHVGYRRENNEDAFAMSGDLSMVVVADGMGGHNAGDVASAIAVETIQSRLLVRSARKPGARGPGGMLADVFADANTRIRTVASTRSDYHNMATTVVAVWIVGDEAHVAHVGDSRLYHLRDGQITRVTQDHSLLNEYLRAGVLSPEDAHKFPYPKVLARGLGTNRALKVDTAVVTVRHGDRLLLCSDGLTDLVSDEEIAELLAKPGTPEAVAATLLAAALDAGGIDNVTAAVIEVPATDEEAPPEEEETTSP